MSYLSSTDMAVLQPTLRSNTNWPATHLPSASPIGPALEVLLMVVTNLALSFVFCAAIAGALRS